MKALHKNLLLATVPSVVGGLLATSVVVGSSNGYSAGLIMFPLLILIGLISMVLFVVGFVCLFVDQEIGLYLLLAMILLPGTFLGSAIVAKQLELGAYKEEPMTPIIPPIANKVVFKGEATHDQVQRFWKEVLSESVGPSGERSRPGIQAISSSLPENGREVVLFSFFAHATEEQKTDIRNRVLSYSSVDVYLENIEIKPFETPALENSNTNISNVNDARVPSKFVNSQ